MKVLIAGGYGTFGARLVRLLADEPALTVLVGGRSLARAQAFCAPIPARAKLEAVFFDRSADAARQIAALKPDAVVDASGPFQAYGGAYAVVKACIENRVHYLDLADASAFVEGIAQFDAAAQAAGVAVLSGVSTFPVLSSAAVRALSRNLSPHSIAAGIAPGPRAGIGRNVIAAIASYGGRPVRVWRQGKASSAYGLCETRRFTIAPPGRIPLTPRLFALADVPDLALAPKQWPSVTEVWTGAGTKPALWFRGLVMLASLVRAGVLPSLSPFVGLFHWVSNRLVWGEHRGGMFVEVRGTAPDGEAVTRSWHLIAEGDEGPFIPAMAACLILKKWLRGEAPAPGARPCTAELELADYAPLFAQHGIVTGVREERATDATLPLYRRCLGEAWDGLPDSLRAMHDGTGTWEAEGRAQIERGRGALARIAAALFRFPKAGDDVPVAVRFESSGGRETWTRDFAGRCFASVQHESRESLLCETFGPFTFAMALVPDGNKLRLIQRGWRVFGIPLPMALAPRGDTFESEDNGRFRFHVEIGFPWTGPIVHYRGWLVRR